MLSLDHFVVDDNCNLKKSDFLSLCIDSKNLDKDNFLESVYFIDEKDFEESKSKGASPSRKEKQPVEDHPDRVLGASNRRNTINIDDDDQ